MTLLRWLTFLLVLLFWIHFFCLTQAFCLFRSSDVIVSVSIEFPTNSKRDAPFHHPTYDYSHVDWGGVCYRRMFHGRISLNLVVLLLPLNFVS